MSPAKRHLAVLVAITDRYAIGVVTPTTSSTSSSSSSSSWEARHPGVVTGLHPPSLSEARDSDIAVWSGMRCPWVHVPAAIASTARMSVVVSSR